jgi:signal transduction histidine kinase
MGMVFDIQNLKEEDTDQAVKAGLLSLESSLKNAIQELRQFVNELRPPTLIDVGLVEAIQKHATDIHEKFPELELGIDLDERINVLSERLSLTLYRICQEALQNAIRHAKATRVVIHGSSDDDQVILIIQDNGIGFSATNHFAELAANQHYGLTGMKERAEAVGGTLQVVSKPGSGTRIQACIPLHQTIIQTIARQPNCARDLLA